MNEIIESDFIPIKLDDILDISYSKQNYKKGMADGSYLAGIIVSILNTGISECEASKIICTAIQNKYLGIEKDV